ncbi:MAG TPA: GH3 auxin-responsive promoter family protein, partial [Chitinophagaceae bacterium]|nr:GH3 auxin-responsive promoter family protein [Chitinophagaceae bacterium]
MGLKSTIAKPFAQIIARSVHKNSRLAIQHQEQLRAQLVRSAAKTQFGQDHHFSQIDSHRALTQAIPIRDYEQLKPYIEKIKNGDENILWPGKPVYFAKTSGTTSGVKYIPITRESIPFHIQAARNALLCYIAETGNTQFTDGKMIFLSGSPELETIHGIYTGRLSGIVNHHVPAYLTKNRMPSFETNCIEDWETKLDRIVDETIQQDMRLISGIPPWMQMYFDRLVERSGKSIADLFPNLSVIAHGGVNFEPYKAKLFDTLGKKIDTIETFPASEGFFAYQDSQQLEGLLLNTNAGMYFEFIPAHEIFNDTPTRLSLAEVKLDTNYALIIHSNAGLWAYNIGDTIKFVSLDPYRIIVSGRIKHFISAFGEHVIAEEVEYAMRMASEKFNVRTIEFTVAPFIASDNGSSYHEWLIEFETIPDHLNDFANEVDRCLQEKNIYYRDLIQGGILQRLQIAALPKNSFIQYMKKIGKLGGQNK